MKIKIHLIFIIILFSNTVFAIKNISSLRISGKVICAGKGVSSVMVTDGKSIVKTDKNGSYILNSCSSQDFVYYSLPAGYDSPVKNSSPVFYEAINPALKNQTINFSILKSEKSQIKHAFILLADPQVHDLDEFDLLDVVMDDVRKTALELSPEYPVHAISCGDNVFDKPEFFDKYKKLINKSGLAVYQTIGNHDMDYNNRSDELSGKSFSAAFGPTHYSFNKGNIHYIVLKDVFYYGFSYKYIGYVNEEQLSWLENDLSEVKPGSTVVVTLHIPTIYGESEKADNFSTEMANSVLNRAALYKILSPFNVHILAGHSHTQWNTVVSPTLFEHTHVAACAAWWQGETAVDGSPKGYTVYIVDGNKIQWYLKGVNKAKDDQFKIYPSGSDSLYPDCIIANVYNYDPEWKVVWYENGKMMGEMQQYWGEDPLARSLYPAGGNKKYRWLKVGETHHLFKAKLQQSDAKVTVNVTDRFGNIYSKSL